MRMIITGATGAFNADPRVEYEYGLRQLWMNYRPGIGLMKRNGIHDFTIVENSISGMTEIVMIEQKIPAMAVEKINSMLAEHPNYIKYVMNTLNEFNTELKQLDTLEKDLKYKAVRLFTECRKKSLDESGLPDKLKTHMKCLISTVGNIQLRKLKPKWAVVDRDLKLHTKWYWNLQTALRRKERLLFAEPAGKWDNFVLVSWNDYRELQYEKKKLNGKKSKASDSDEEGPQHAEG
jgi:hypothetical protein